MVSRFFLDANESSARQWIHEKGGFLGAIRLPHERLVITAGDEIVIRVGTASLTMKKDGTIELKGNNIAISGFGETTIKASRNVVLKGQKVLQN